MRKFYLLNPFEYRREEILNLMAHILCDGKRRLNYETAVFLISHSKNMFPGVFKDNFSVMRIVASFNYNFNVCTTVRELLKCKSFSEIVGYLNTVKN